MTPAEIIRSAREALAMSQTDLAREVGVNLRTVMRWESGESRPRNRHLLRLCRVLGIDPEAMG